MGMATSTYLTSHTDTGRKSLALEKQVYEDEHRVSLPPLQCLSLTNGMYVIRAVRTMLSIHPYNIWPLNVKFFTKEALKHWQDADKALNSSLALPFAFQYSIELEGVDGKAGDPGSGRKGPIVVTDGTLAIVFLTTERHFLMFFRRGFCCSAFGKMHFYYGTSTNSLLLYLR